MVEEKTIDNKAEIFYKALLEDKLIKASNSMPRVYFTREEQDFFRTIKDSISKCGEDICKSYIERYFELRKIYVKRAMRHF